MLINDMSMVTLSQTISSFRVNSQPFLIKIGGIKPPEDLETFAPPKCFQEKSLGNPIITKRRPRANMKVSINVPRKASELD